MRQTGRFVMGLAIAAGSTFWSGELSGQATDLIPAQEISIDLERAGEAAGEVCGHLHPAAKVAGRGRRLRCFATDGARMILPAFGAYAGGLSVRDEAIRSVFGRCPDAWVLGRDAVYPIPAKRVAG